MDVEHITEEAAKMTLDVDMDISGGSSFPSCSSDQDHPGAQGSVNNIDGLRAFTESCGDTAKPSKLFQQLQAADKMKLFQQLQAADTRMCDCGCGPCPAFGKVPKSKKKEGVQESLRLLQKGDHIFWKDATLFSKSNLHAVFMGGAADTGGPTALAPIDAQSPASLGRGLSKRETKQRGNMSTLDLRVAVVYMSDLVEVPKWVASPESPEQAHHILLMAEGCLGLRSTDLGPMDSKEFVEAIYAIAEECTRKGNKECAQRFTVDDAHAAMIRRVVFEHADIISAAGGLVGNTSFRIQDCTFPQIPTEELHETQSDKLLNCWAVPLSESNQWSAAVFGEEWLVDTSDINWLLELWIDYMEMPVPTIAGGGAGAVNAKSSVLCAAMEVRLKTSRVVSSGLVRDHPLLARRVGSCAQVLHLLLGWSHFNEWIGSHKAHSAKDWNEFRKDLLWSVAALASTVTLAAKCPCSRDATVVAKLRALIASMALFLDFKRNWDQTGHLEHFPAPPEDELGSQVSMFSLSKLLNSRAFGEASLKSWLAGAAHAFTGAELEEDVNAVFAIRSSLQAVDTALRNPNWLPYVDASATSETLAASLSKKATIMAALCGAKHEHSPLSYAERPRKAPVPGTHSVKVIDQREHVTAIHVDKVIDEGETDPKRPWFLKPSVAFPSKVIDEGENVPSDLMVGPSPEQQVREEEEPVPEGCKKKKQSKKDKKKRHAGKHEIDACDAAVQEKQPEHQTSTEAIVWLGGRPKQEKQDQAQNDNLFVGVGMWFKAFQQQNQTADKVCLACGRSLLHRQCELPEEFLYCNHICAAKTGGLSEIAERFAQMMPYMQAENVKRLVLDVFRGNPQCSRMQLAEMAMDKVLKASWTSNDEPDSIVSFEPPEHCEPVLEDDLAESLEEEASALLELAIDESEKLKCAQTLFAMLERIAAEPDNPRLRTLRLTNPRVSQELGRHAPALALLRFAGFDQEQSDGEPHLVFSGDAYASSFQSVLEVVQELTLSLQATSESLTCEANAPVSSSDVARLTEARLRNPKAFFHRGLAKGSKNPEFKSAQYPYSAPTKSDSQGQNRLIAHRVLDAANQYRVSKALPPLEWHDGIADIAMEHALRIASGEAPLSHAGFQSRLKSYPVAYTKAAENLAQNHNGATPARTVVEDWIKSPPHERNLCGQFHLCGVGVARSSKGILFFVQLFAG